jgi:hypothetical protein
MTAKETRAQIRHCVWDQVEVTAFKVWDGVHAQIGGHQPYSPALERVRDEVRSHVLRVNWGSVFEQIQAQIKESG